MADRAWILSSVAISIPWFAAIVAAATRRQARLIGFFAALISVLASALLLAAALAHPKPGQESLGAVLMVLFSCLAVVAMLILPRRDCSPGTIGGMLFILGSTLLGYATGNLLVLLAAWVLTTIPFFVARLFGARTWRPRLGLLLSSIALAIAIAFIAAEGRGMTIGRLKGQSPGGVAVFALLVLAVILRKGICPAHAWVADAAEGGPAIPTALLLNGHFGPSSSQS
jgi:NADH:ubiquinone oxidoreductase subunit 2 (subunit N)